MTHNNYTKNILNIKDQNIYFGENCFNIVKINNIDTMFFHGVLTYKPTSCPYCGVINNSNDDIINWEFKKNCKIKIPKISNYNSLVAECLINTKSANKILKKSNKIILFFHKLPILQYFFS